MDRELYERVCVWFDAHREAMIDDIKRLVRIESVSRPGEEGTPFGAGCRRALEEMLAIGREHGFHTENYGDMLGSIGRREKNWENLIGFWNHLDVVPAGNDWDYAPFDPVVREHFLIGRGAQDNKGPAVGMLYVMQCLRELEVPLKHELCLFVGTDEERGMEDVEYYTAHYPVPRLNMIADSGFPVCYGEKGIIEGRLVSERCVSSQVLEVYGGSATNMIPDQAGVLLRDSEALRRELAGRLGPAGRRADLAGKAGGSAGETGLEKPAGSAGKRAEPSDSAGKRAEPSDSMGKATVPPGNGPVTWEIQPEGIRVTARGLSRHSAFPQGSVNAIHELSRILMELEPLPQGDRDIFRVVERTSREYYGVETGIACQDRLSGRTTCAATVLSMEEGHICLVLNIRYALTAKDEENIRTLGIYGIANGMQWQTDRNSKPSYFPREHPAVDRLTNLYNEITGQNQPSFVMGGGTYARKLPRAFAYGIGGMQENDADREAQERLFRPGHGGAHAPDEALNLLQFLEAMKIYAMAVAELNETEL